MTKQQAKAFARPCFEAEQCADGYYRVFSLFKGRQWCHILTLNMGLE